MANNSNFQKLPHCIIIADDDQDDQDLLREALMEISLPAQINTVDNGVELLEHLQQTFEKKLNPYPCLIILDINMPKKNGIDTLKDLKKNPAYKSIPVIIYSTSHNEETKTNCQLMGAANYIHKPVSHDELREVARSIKSYWTKMVEPSLSQHLIS